MHGYGRLRREAEASVGVEIDVKRDVFSQL